MSCWLRYLVYRVLSSNLIKMVDLRYVLCSCFVCQIGKLIEKVYLVFVGKSAFSGFVSIAQLLLALLGLVGFSWHLLTFFVDHCWYLLASFSFFFLFRTRESLWNMHCQSVRPSVYAKDHMFYMIMSSEYLSGCHSFI